jgi:GNAT superfamily N-acetyltransferase
MAGSFRRWLSPRLTDGRYCGFIAEQDGRPVGGAGLLELDWPPHPAHPSDCRRGYVLNVFIEPEYRHRGIARHLLAATETEFTRRNIGYAVLHTTALGRPLYESTGWKPSPEMAKTL